jgi:hypothetical protein
MERRELLKMITLATGSVLIGGEFLLTGCKNPAAGKASFTAENIALLDEIGETILPKTNTPGAKEAEVGKFMSVMVTDCYDAQDQKTFMEGISKLDKACEAMHKTGFLKATPEQRTALLTALDKEAKEYNKTKGEHDKAENEKAKADAKYEKKRMDNHYFTQMKQLTLQGYFTSKPALTQAFDYHAVPGRYDGAVPYKKGDKMFA